MIYASLRHLAALLCPFIIAACGTKRAPRYCPNGPIFDLPAQFDGSRRVLHMILRQLLL